MQIKEQQLLKHFSLFSSLNEDTFQDVIKYASIKKVPKHSYIFEEGEEGSALYILMSGLVKVCHSTIEGKEIVLHLVREGGIFGETSAFQVSSNPSPQPASAYTLKESVLLVFSKADLEQSVLAHSDWALQLLSHISLRLRMFTRKLESRGEKNTMQRLAAYLVHRSRLEGNNTVLDLGVSQEILGGILGTSRESVSRALSKLSDDNYLEIKGKTIHILNMPALESL